MIKWSFYLFILVLFSCSSKIVNYINPDAKFETLKSFRLVNVKIDNRETASEDLTIINVMEEKILEEMDERGYLRSGVDPDLTLRYEFVSSMRSDMNVNQRRSLYYYNPVPTVTTRTIYESILLLELYDQNNKLVWLGSYDMRQNRRDERNIKTVNEAVNEIFTTYPYRAGQQAPDPSLTERGKND